MSWKEKNWKFKVGIIILSVSIILFILLIIIPFIQIERNIKITISTVIFILAEVMFYSGGFLLGKELFNKYKALLNPKNWFKNKSLATDSKIETTDNKLTDQ